MSHIKTDDIKEVRSKLHNGKTLVTVEMKPQPKADDPDDTFSVCHCFLVTSTKHQKFDNDVKNLKKTQGNQIEIPEED